MLTLNITQPPGSPQGALRGAACEDFHIKGIIRSRFFSPASLMKNAQRRIHYSAELSECDKRGAGATEGSEAALHRGPGPLSSFFYALLGFFQMVEGATRGRRPSACRPVLCTRAHWTVSYQLSVFYSVMRVTPDPHLAAFMLLINSSVIIVWQDKWTGSWQRALYVMNEALMRLVVKTSVMMKYDYFWVLYKSTGLLFI